MGTVDGSLFEGLARTFKPEGAFAADLRAVGFDLRSPRVHYPVSVLLAVLDVIHRHAFPELSREEAHRWAGRRMVSTFFETILGKVIQTLLRALGLQRFLLRLPKIAPMGTTGLDIEVVPDGPGALRLIFRSESTHPVEFVAGALEGGARGISDELRVQIAEVGATDFELRVTGLR